MSVARRQPLAAFSKPMSLCGMRMQLVTGGGTTIPTPKAGQCLIGVKSPRLHPPLLLACKAQILETFR
jgi:hypothetical protein